MSRKQDPLDIEFILLGLIHKQPIHAYDLYKLVSSDKDIKPIWRFNQSQLYAQLDKLERNGLITTKTETSGKYPARKVNYITPEGESLLRNWLQTPVSHNNEIRSEFMAKLYFLKDEPAAEYRALILAQISEVERWIAQQQVLMNEEDSEFLGMLYSYRMEMNLAVKTWLGELLELRR